MSDLPEGTLGTPCNAQTSELSCPRSRELGFLCISSPQSLFEGWRRRGQARWFLSCMAVHAWGGWLALVWGVSRALSGMGVPKMCAVLLCSCDTNYNPETSRLPQSPYTLRINFCIIFHNGISTHLVLSHWTVGLLWNGRGTLPTGPSLIRTPNLNAGEHSDIGEWSTVFLKSWQRLFWFCFVEQGEQKLVWEPGTPRVCNTLSVI